jgi:hypothetical protein
MRRMDSHHTESVVGLLCGVWLGPETGHSVNFELGVGLPTPPQVLTVGLLCGVWHGQETGHSVRYGLWHGQETGHSVRSGDRPQREVDAHVRRGSPDPADRSVGRRYIHPPLVFSSGRRERRRSFL